MSPLKLSFFIGLRYVVERGQRRFVSFIFWFSLIGMTLGVTALIVVMSIMNGFNHEIKDRFLTILPQGTFSYIPAANLLTAPNTYPNKEPELWRETANILLQNKEIEAVSPSVNSMAILQSDDALLPIQLHGINPISDQQVVDLQATLVLGSLDHLSDYGIVLGHITTQQLGLRIGDRVQVTIPKVNITPLGLFPRVRNMTLVAIFESNSEMDSKLAFIHIDNALKLLRQKQITQLRVKTSDPDNNQVILAKALQQLNNLPSSQKSFAAQAKNNQHPWQVEPWQQPLFSLFQAMQMEKRITGLLLAIIVMVAAFNIISGLSMMVADKRSDIAVLRTLGASSKIIGQIFLVQGLLLGWSGIILGAIIGSLLSVNINSIMIWLQSTFGLTVFDPNVFYISVLPSIWRWQDFIIIVAGAAITSVVFSVFPARHAAKISPSESLLYHQ